MSAYIHEKVLKVGTVAAFMIIFLASPGVEETEAFRFLCGSFILFLVLLLMFIYLVPVRCSRDDCTGRMQPGWDREPLHPFYWYLFYKCKTCGHFYKTEFNFGADDRYRL